MCGTGTEPQVIERVAQLVTAFATVQKKRMKTDDKSLTELVHKVCYRWNKKAHSDLTKRPEFQQLLKLPAFEKQQMLATFKDGELECRAKQYSNFMVIHE